VKTIQVMISERFYIRGEKLFQHFSYDKKFDKFLKDKRFSIYEDFEVKIKQKSINLHFIQRREEQGKVVFEYDLIKGYIKPKNNYFTIFQEIPTTLNCEFCKYADLSKRGFIYCNYKQRPLSYKIKNCSFFRQKRKK